MAGPVTAGGVASADAGTSMVKDSRRWEAPAALERHRRGSGFCLDGEVTQIAFRPVHDRHGKQRRFEVAVIRVVRARTGPKFEDEPVCTEADVRRALLPAYELLGYDEEDLDLYDGLPFLFLPIQLSFVPTVGSKVNVITDGDTPFLAEVSEAIVHRGIEQVLLQQQQQQQLQRFESPPTTDSS